MVVMSGALAGVGLSSVEPAWIWVNAATCFVWSAYVAEKYRRRATSELEMESV